MSKFYLERSDASGNVFTNTSNPATPYQVFEGEVDQLDKSRIHILAPEWMREQQNHGFGWANTVLHLHDVWEVDGPVRALTPREYMQLAKKECPDSNDWVGQMRELFEECSSL